MLDPRTIWLAVLAVAVAYGGWRLASPSSLDNPRVAYLSAPGDKSTTLLPVSEDDCRRDTGRLWIESDRHVECIAYVAPSKAPRTELAVLYFPGDVRRETPLEQRHQRMQASFQRRVEALASRHGVAFVAVGRPGTMGSSGEHLIGGRRDEALIANVAVDELKLRLGIKRLVLAGQSGGARLAAQLLTLGRTDIECAVLGSGAYGIPRLKGGGTRSTDIFGNPGHRYLVPMREAGSIPADAARRIFVLGDPRDERTPFDGQRAFAEELVRLGHHAVLIEASATGKEHHGLSDTSLEAAGLCAKGASDGEIRSAVEAASKPLRNRQ